jgi:polynucleotide 5'-hydroxyl-kinase GRC3/NOL9
LEYPILWQRTITNLCDGAAKKNQIIAIAGGLHSGKSTLSRFLVNKILTPAKGLGKPLVAFLDLDPGRPELSLPGHIGLYFLEQPLLKASFTRQRLQTHPWDISFYVGNTLSGSNETLYLMAMKELFNRIPSKELEQHSGIIVVHCPGWCKGFGNTTFTKILDICHFTDIVCLSEIPDMVSEAVQNMVHKPIIHSLNSQSLIPSQSIRAPSELSDMILLAHFHFQNRAGSKLDLTPITSWRPWVVSYNEKRRDFRGFYFVDELPSMRPGMLTQVLNGSIVSAALIDEDHVLPDVEIGDGDGIPYFPAESLGYSDLPHPSKMRVIGLLLIRSIDAENKMLMCLNCSGLSEYPKERIILIAWGMQTPGWAYTEDIEYREYAKHTSDENASSYLVRGSKEYPWVEISAKSMA